jgi:hypothetical protein
MLKYCFLFLIACSSNYGVHDPNSYCQRREIELQVRPAIQCESVSSSCEPKCNYGVVVSTHWKCKRWSSW